MKFRVQYFYLATGMEGIPDERDYGIVEAKTKQEAIEQVVMKELPEDKMYGPDNKWSTRDFLRSCLSAELVEEIDKTFLKNVNELIEANLHPSLVGEVSDGYHTFNELYEHRFELWITICRIAADFKTVFEVLGAKPTSIVIIPWRSRKHSDGTAYDGWFILGMPNKEGKQITYHLPDRLWDRCKFAITREEAPEFDGHTSADVIERLKTL